MEAPKTAVPASPQAENKLHFLDYWRIIRIRKTVILAVFLLVVLTTTAVTFLLPESFSSMVRISVAKDDSDISALGYMSTGNQYDPFFIQTEFEKIKSKKVLYKVIEELDLNRRWGAEYNNGVDLKTTESYELLKQMTDVRQTRNTSLIEITVFSDAKEKAPEQAAEIANRIAEVYRQSRLNLRQDMAKGGIAKLKEKLEDHSEKIKLMQDKVDGLRRTNNISDQLAESVGAVSMLEAETVRRIEGERITAEGNYSQLSKLLAELRNLKEHHPENLRGSLLSAYYDPQLAKLLEDLWNTETLYATLRETLGEKNVELKSVVARQAELSKKVNQRVDDMILGLMAKEAALKAQVDSLQREVEAAKGKDAEMTAKYRPYFDAKRELDGLQRVRDVILLKIQQEDVDASLPKSLAVEITDKAEPQRRPVSPNFKLNITLGAIVGLIIGVGLAFFIEYLDTSVKTIDDIERALQAPVLGVIPQNVRSLILEGPESPHAEAYRVLRTNVLFSRKREDANTITVVSGGAGEGKSTTIFNLATTFAQQGQRILLVDSDLRRPSLHKILNLSNSIGLTNLLLGQNTIEQVIQTTPVPTLDFLPSGKLPSSSMGILNSQQMKDFIREAKRRYDFVFFDSPPIMGISDASVIVSEVDMAMQVIQYRKYPQAMTLRAKQMVEKVGGNLLGVVLNNINISQDSYYYYYSGYYYDYYNKSDREEQGEKGEKGPRPKGGGGEDRKEGKRAGLDLKTKY